MRRARAALDRAEVTDHSRWIRFNARLTGALTAFLADGLDAAEAEFACATTEAEGLDPERWRPRWHFQRATVLGRANDIPEALAQMDLALDGLEHFTELEQCAVLITDGLLHAMAGSQRAAAASFGRARALAEALGHDGMRASAIHDEGYAEYLAGNLPRALELVSAGEIEDGHLTPGILLLDRGIVLLDSGLIDDALDTLTAATAYLRRRRPDHTAAEIHLELARAERLVGNLGEAARQAGLARRLYARIGATAWQERAHLLQLGVWVDGGRRVRQVRTESRDLYAAASARADLALADRAAVTAAQAAARQGEWAAATAWLGLVTQAPARGSVAALHHTLVAAEVKVGQGEVRAARRLLTRAARDVGFARRGSASLDLRTAGAVHGVRLAELDLDLALAAGASAVLASLDRWRAATDRLPVVRPPADAELADLTERMRTVVDRLRSAGDPHRVAELGTQLDQLQRAVRIRTWALANAGEAAARESVDVRRARAVLLDLDRDLVWFFEHGGRLFGVGVLRGRAQILELGSAEHLAGVARRLCADLQVMATQQLGALRGSVLASLDASARELDRSLIMPWRSRAEGLVVVAGNELAGLPWATLPSLVGRPVTVARSLSGWASRAGRVAARPRVSVHVGPGLDRAVAEAGAVCRAWSQAQQAEVVGQVDTATARRLTAALANDDVVHVAAHGSHRPDNPLFSAVELAGGPVYAHEFQPSGVQARHVVLSACDVGDAVVRPGGETLGLASSLLALGAGSVVASPRPVPDAVAAEVMAAHHRHLAAGRRVDEALALALAGADVSAASFLALGSTLRVAL